MGIEQRLFFFDMSVCFLVLWTLFWSLPFSEIFVNSNCLGLKQLLKWQYLRSWRGNVSLIELLTTQWHLYFWKGCQSFCAGLILNSVLLYLLLISYQACKLESAAHFGRLFNKLWCGTICMFVVVSWWDGDFSSKANVCCSVHSSYVVYSSRLLSGSVLLSALPITEWKIKPT